jgi:hypothetical protein
MQRLYSFFGGKLKNENYKMILRKVKYGDNENKKCDFRGWFYNFFEIIIWKDEKLSKDPPKLRFL